MSTEGLFDNCVQNLQLAFFQESCFKSHRVMVYKMDLKQF